MNVASSTNSRNRVSLPRGWRHGGVWIVCWLICLPVGVATCKAEEPQKDEQRLKTFEICRKAWVENVQAPWSGTGSSKYVVTVDGKDFEKADVEVEVSQDKYRLKIDRTEGVRPRSDSDSRLVIRDSSAVFCCFGADLKFASKHIVKERFPQIPPERAMFSFGPIRLMTMMDLGTVDKNKIVSAKEVSNGDIELRYVNDRLHARIVCAKEFGYNYRLCESHRGGFDGPVASTETLTWKKMGDRWYVMQAVRSGSMWKDNKKVGEETASFTYASFDPKKVPDDKRFSLESLELPKGGRIQDRRGGGAVQDRYYKLDPPPKPDETIGMLVDRMPIRP